MPHDQHPRAAAPFIWLQGVVLVMWCSTRLRGAIMVLPDDLRECSHTQRHTLKESRRKGKSRGVHGDAGHLVHILDCRLRAHSRSYQPTIGTALATALSKILNMLTAVSLVRLCRVSLGDFGRSADMIILYTIPVEASCWCTSVLYRETQTSEYMRTDCNCRFRGRSRCSNMPR